jgi:hypothetical protein
MKYILFFAVLPLFIACKTNKDAGSSSPEADSPIEEVGTVDQNSNTTGAEEAVADENHDSYSKPQKPYRVKATLGDARQKTDYYTITSAEIQGSLLFLEVEYSGGCGLHQFEFVGDRAISKSLPPQRSVKLLHDNGDDQCEALVSQSIEVDITDLASGNEIILNLFGYNEPLKFVQP